MEVDFLYHWSKLHGRQFDFHRQARLCITGLDLPLVQRDRTARDRQAIHHILEDRSFERVSVEELKAILKRNDSIEYAMAIADRYAEQAREALELLPESDFRRALEGMPAFVVSREK